MNQTQKGAVYGLILVLVLLFIPFFDFIETRYQLPWPVKLLIGIPWFLAMILPIILIERKKHPEPFDERDKQICLRATLWAFLILFLIFLAAYIIILFWFESFTLKAGHLPVLIYGSLSAFIFLLSSGVLIQYISLNKQAERSQS